MADDVRSDTFSNPRVLQQGRDGLADRMEHQLTAVPCRGLQAAEPLADGVAAVAELVEGQAPDSK